MDSIVVDTIIVLKGSEISFWSIFIPAFLVFIFSLILFFVTKGIGIYLERKSLKKSVLKEFDLNISYLNHLIKICEKIESQSFTSDFFERIREKEQIFQPVRFGYKRYFTEQYLTKGYFYQIFKSNDIEKLEGILYSMADDYQYAFINRMNEMANVQLGLPGLEQKGKIRDYVRSKKELFCDFVKFLKNAKKKI